MLRTLFWFKYGFSLSLLLLRLLRLLITFYLWFRDILRESRFQGAHTLMVQVRLKWGLVWFLFREVWFFFRVFWRFFHVRVAPLSGRMWRWPLEGILAIPYAQVPILNTIILLARGVTATLAHHEFLKGQKSHWIIIRVFLGIYFLTLQGVEYFASSFTISSRVFGRVFFFGTGFHGLHVCLGAIILIIRIIRIEKAGFNSQHHFGVEFSLWYWHFVDVVWLFLFFWVYIWGRL
jgi:heme/copper-type cytochrome/quinol oxidase subunit 3